MSEFCMTDLPLIRQNFRALGPDLNAFCLDFPTSFLSELQKVYREKLAPVLQAPEHQNWFEGVYYQSQEVANGDYYLLSYDTHPLLWLSNHNLKTYRIFERFFKALQLEAQMRAQIHFRKRLIMYSGFWVLGNRAEEQIWHYDYRPGAQAYTLITPLFDWHPAHGHLCYQDASGQEQIYAYRKNQAIVFGEGFYHCTQPYPPSSELRVLVSFTFGTDLWDRWEILKQNIAEQSYFYVQPCGHPVDTCACLKFWHWRQRLCGIFKRQNRPV